jgi:hypothetical protein
LFFFNNEQIGKNDVLETAIDRLTFGHAFYLFDNQFNERRDNRELETVFASVPSLTGMAGQWWR